MATNSAPHHGGGPALFMGAAVLTSALQLASCGSSAPPARVTSEFTAELAEVFEDGADYVEDPEVLEGLWRDEWSRDLDRRVSYSDLIVQVSVAAIHTDTDLDRRSAVRLEVHIDDVMLGDPPGEQLTLRVREGEPGYGTLEGNDTRLLREHFVAFVKWYQGDGQILAHWHLSPSADGVVRRVRYLVEQRRTAAEDQSERRVIVQDD